MLTHSTVGGFRPSCASSAGRTAIITLLHASFSADMTARTIDGSASVKKLAPPHWAKEPSTLTSSANAIIDQGTASPKAYAARLPHVFCSDLITQRRSEE